MPNQKITDYSVMTSSNVVNADDLMEIVDFNVLTNKKITVQELGKAVAKVSTANLSTTGFTTPSVTTVAPYKLQGTQVSLFISTQISGTSSSSSFTITGIPSEITPATNHSHFLISYVDGGGAGSTPGLATVSTDSTIVLYVNPSGQSWGTSGTKTLNAGLTLVYSTE